MAVWEVKNRVRGRLCSLILEYKYMLGRPTPYMSFVLIIIIGWGGGGGGRRRRRRAMNDLSEISSIMTQYFDTETVLQKLSLRQCCERTTNIVTWSLWRYAIPLWEVPNTIFREEEETLSSAAKCSWRPEHAWLYLHTHICTLFL